MWSLQRVEGGGKLSSLLLPLSKFIDLCERKVPPNCTTYCGMATIHLLCMHHTFYRCAFFFILFSTTTLLTLWSYRVCVLAGWGSFSRSLSFHRWANWSELLLQPLHELLPVHHSAYCSKTRSFFYFVLSLVKKLRVVAQRYHSDA